MFASDYAQSLPNHRGFSPATLARLRGTAWRDAPECTGNALLCGCSWHRCRRQRDPADPYGLKAAAYREDRRWASETARWLRAQLPEVIRHYPDVLTGHLQAITACDKEAR